MNTKTIKLSPKKGNHGHITSYTVNIGSAEARKCGFSDEGAELEKVVDVEKQQIVIRTKKEEIPPKKDSSMKQYSSVVECISFDVSGRLELSLLGFPYLMFVKPSELHRGGKNGEIKRLVVGSKITFEYSGVTSVRELRNVTILSDGTSEVDEDGNLIKW